MTARWFPARWSADGRAGDDGPHCKGLRPLTPLLWAAAW